LVSVVNGGADRLEEAKTKDELLAREGAGAAPQPLGERVAVDELHREEVVAIGGGSGLVDRRDRRALEPPQRLGFAPEHPRVDLVTQEPLLENLQRNAAARVWLLGLPDDPHAALAEEADDAVVPDRLRHRPRVGRWRRGRLLARLGG